MILVNLPCDNCKHIRDNIDGWKCACDAFPSGIPKGFMFQNNITELKECNNGIGYEPKDK